MVRLTLWTESREGQMVAVEDKAADGLEPGIDLVQAGCRQLNLTPAGHTYQMMMIPAGQFVRQVSIFQRQPPDQATPHQLFEGAIDSGLSQTRKLPSGEGVDLDRSQVRSRAAKCSQNGHLLGCDPKAAGVQTRDEFRVGAHADLL